MKFLQITRNTLPSQVASQRIIYIYSQCCEAVDNETLLYINASEPTIQKYSSIRERIPLTKAHLISYQSTTYHVITFAYKLIQRANATDPRFRVPLSLKIMLH